jgi:hypothetical protein
MARVDSHFELLWHSDIEILSIFFGKAFEKSLEKENFGKKFAHLNSIWPPWAIKCNFLVKNGKFAKYFGPSEGQEIHFLPIS